MDNLLLYLQKHFGRRLVVSGEEGDLLVWGDRQGQAIRLLGLSLNAAASEPATPSRLLELGQFMERQLRLPFLVIRYPPDLDMNPLAELILDGEKVRVGEAARRIQERFGTRYRQAGTGKEVNKATHDAFHRWARLHLPYNYVRSDLDAFLLAAETDCRPRILLEIKRSTLVAPASWQPYAADARNYFIQKMLADRLGLEFLTLNHNCRDMPVTDGSKIGVHRIQRVSLNPPRIVSEKTLLSAQEATALLLQRLGHSLQ